ncbi:MAG: RluA family pseudouridine synthase [Myxococcota bacterium]
MILAEHLSALGHSKKELKSLLQNGKVYHHGVPTSDDRREVDPDKIEIRPRGPRLTPGRDPVIVYKDKSVAVVYKPAAYLSVRAPGRHKDPNIMGFVHRICGNALPVHRLDEDTSGLMLVALTETSQQHLKTQLEARTVERIYLTLASGHLSEAMTVDSILTRNRGDGRRGTADRIRSQYDKRAVSHFTPIEHLKKATLIQAKLETGRTHQIRIHLSENKHPVLGDSLYAPPKIQHLAPRLALHAHSIGFEHPSTGKIMSFVAPLADDLERLRRRLTFKKNTH